MTSRAAAAVPWLRMARGWRAYPPATRRLMLARASRSLWQGALVVDFSLYLEGLGWSMAAIGLLLTGAGLGGAGLSLLAGHLSDRHGRRPLLLLYEALTLFSGAVALATAAPAWLAAATVVSSLGRGQAGGAGPFGPVEQAWLGRTLSPSQRGPAFSLNAAIGFVGMALGALLAGFPGWLSHGHPTATDFRPLFALVMASAIVNLWLIGPLPEPGRTPAPAPTPAADLITRRENRELLKLVLINLANGLAVGLTGPLTALWFAVKFHVTPGAIGGTMAATFLAIAAANLMTGRIGRRFGWVRAIVAIRLAGVAMLVLIPLMPSFAAASVLYFLRGALTRGSVGPRQAVTISLTRDSRRGLAAGLNFVSMRVPASAGPALSAGLMQDGSLDAPFYLAAVLQLAYALLYGRLFRQYDRLSTPDESVSRPV